VVVSKVTWVHHWNENVFSFRCERPDSLRFRNGEFIMIGLMVEEKPLVRAYSMVSPNHDEELEFLSIKVQDGPLTSLLQHIKVGEYVLIGGKPTGTLTIDDLNPGRRLMLFASGTGLAPFMSVIRDPETFEKFDYVELWHSVRDRSDAAYKDYITYEMMNNIYGEFVNGSLEYHSVVTRGIGCSQRVTTQMENKVIGVVPTQDRAMICGSPGFLADVTKQLESHGMEISPAAGKLGDFVIERAFVD